MPDENEQEALTKIKAYLDAGHSLDAVRQAGWDSWVDHLLAAGYDLKTGQLALRPPDNTPGPSPQLASDEAMPAPETAEPPQTADTQPLQDEIARRSADGWELISRAGGEAQMYKPKRFGFGWALLWSLLLPFLGLIVYLLYHWSKQEEIYLRMVDGHLDIAHQPTAPDEVGDEKVTLEDSAEMALELPQEARKVVHNMKWQHKQVKLKAGGMVTPNLDKGEKILEEHSRDGWELINVVPLPRSGGTIEQVYYLFKKPDVE